MSCGQRVGGNDGDIAAHAREATQDVALEAVVDGDDFILAAVGIGVARGPVPFLLVPLHALGEGDILGEIEAFEAAPGLGHGEQLLHVELALGIVGDDAVGHALVADQVGEFAGVDARQADDASGLQPFVEMLGGAVIGGLGDGGLDHAAFDGGGGREVGGFKIVIIGADIADVGEGEGDDLAGIGGVGEDFLIAGHGGVEADFAHGLAFGAKALAFDDGAIGEDEKAGDAGRVPIAESLAWFGLGLFRAGHHGISGNFELYGGGGRVASRLRLRGDRRLFSGFSTQG